MSITQEYKDKAKEELPRKEAMTIAFDTMKAEIDELTKALRSDPNYSRGINITMTGKSFDNEITVNTYYKTKGFPAKDPDLLLTVKYHNDTDSYEITGPERDGYSRLHMVDDLDGVMRWLDKRIERFLTEDEKQTIVGYYQAQHLEEHKEVDNPTAGPSDLRQEVVRSRAAGELWTRDP